MYKQLAFIIILFISMGFQGHSEPDYNPMFFSMMDEWKDISLDQLIFECESLDTVYHIQVSHQMRLLSDKDGAPRFFFSEIKTPVCADGVCQLAHINVYWNLLGNYVGYGISTDFPLTKFDHERFKEEDYGKLHQLLLDENSIVKNRKISDLIDKTPVDPTNIASKDLDGISGATKTEIAESMVKGGLYSCYTLWHLVHGDLKEQMKRYFEALDFDMLMPYFLDAPYGDYQMYALKQLSEDDFKNHSTQITSIFRAGDGLTRVYIFKKIPRDVLSDQEITSQLYKEFSRIDINSRTLLINRLKSANPVASEILSKQLDSMSKNQLKLYLEFLSSNPIGISKACLSNLKKASKNERITYHYLISDFLNDTQIAL